MYDYKLWQEVGWAALVATLTYLSIILATDFSQVSDWRAFAVSAVAGLARALVAAVLAVLTKRASGDDHGLQS